MQVEGENWFYSDIVKEHFLNPKNFLKDKKDILDFNGYGKVGNVKCGDIMEMWIKIKNDKIIDCKWKTFGCASAIASTSMLSVMLTENGGMKLNDAMKLSGKEITDRLGGLPGIKIHCSVLGDEALREAIKDYQSKNKG
ncbi:MAG: iron-sulfur cluster assembly scaffold protein [Candidatus ainarchaeum sp.]|nr:iron-sulfur cluster assembly scaffold protein [Candidatus ainarchaeum sp.]